LALKSFNYFSAFSRLLLSSLIGDSA